jgi:serine/threonine-protein kinase
MQDGDILDKQWRVVKKLGEGGMGAVYLCRHVHNPAHPPVAVKIMIRGDDRTVARFMREREVMFAVNHPNVVRCLEFGAHIEPGGGKFRYIVMDAIDGGSLREFRGYRVVETREAAWILYQTVMGLRAVRHACRGAIHRDLKPENLLLTRAAGSQQVRFEVGNTTTASLVKVSDWGLVLNANAMMQERLTASTDCMGTPAYMSPEQCRSSKHVTIQSDLYALGVILYEMVVGAPPHNGASAMEIIIGHLQNEPVIPAGLDPRVTAVITRCLDKNPLKRYASLRELVDGLTPLLELPASWSYGVPTPPDVADEPETADGSGLLGRIKGMFGRKGG